MRVYQLEQLDITRQINITTYNATQSWKSSENIMIDIVALYFSFVLFGVFAEIALVYGGIYLLFTQNNLCGGSDVWCKRLSAMRNENCLNVLIDIVIWQNVKLIRCFSFRINNERYVPLEVTMKI